MWLRVIAIAALVFSVVRSVQAREHKGAGASISWQGILGAYANGAEITRGFAIVEMGRGHEDDVALEIARAGALEERFFVHIVPRGRWTGIRESRSFGIAYEISGARAATDDMDAVTEVLAGVVRSADTGFSSVNAIPLGAEADPTAMPGWSDALRGATGRAIGMSLVALGAIVTVPGVVTSLLGLAIAALARGVLSEKLEPAIPSLLLILLAFALAFLIADLSRRGELRHRAVWAIGALGLSLRLGLGTFGPFRIHGVAPIWIDAAAGHPEAVAAYGPGYPELFGPIAHLVPGSPDFALFAANAVLSATIPIAAFALSRLAGGGAFHASMAALLLALDPVSIRFAATESYFVPISALSAWSMVTVAFASEHALARRAHASLGAMMGAAVLITVTARIHPVAFPPLLLVPTAALALRARAAHLITLGLVVLGMLIATSGDPLLDVIHHMRAGALLQNLPSGAVPAPRLTLPGALALAAAAILLFSCARTRRLCVPATAMLGAMLMLMHVYDQSALWQQSFCRLYLTLPVVALAMLVPVPPPGARIVFALGALLALGLWAGRALPLIQSRTTEHLEYRWIRAWLSMLPADCRTVYVASAGRSGLFLPTYAASARPASSFIAVHAGEPDTLLPALPPRGCMYYIRTSACSVHGARPDCEAVERSFTLVPVLHTRFPAAPSSDHIQYAGDVIESGIYRIEAR